MSRRFILREAREDRRILLRSEWRDKRALYNHYARNYVYESDLRGIPKSHVACCMMVSERYRIHPQELINEGIWGSIKNFFKRGEKAAEKKDETMDVSEEEIQAYMDSKAGVFKRWEQAKKDGASTWQGLKHAFGGIGSMFQQGQQVWDVTGKAGAKLQIQAKKGFEQIKDQLNSDFLKPIMQDLNKALKDEKLGQPQSGGFPNNPRAADFRHMLYGHTRFKDLEASGQMRGIFGYMLNAKAAIQQAVDNAILDAETGNATVKKMVKVLQYYNGALDDSKRSAESRRAGMQHGNLLTSYSLQASMMGSDYWYTQMLRESDEGEEEVGAEVINIKDLIQGDAPEGTGELSPEDAKALGEFLSDPDNNEPPGGLSDKALNSMIAADGVLGPLIVACVGAAFVAAGVTMGGNPFGDFEDSYAYTKFMNSLKGTEIHKLPDTIAEEMTEYTVDGITVEPGEGLTQMMARISGMDPKEIDGLTMGQFKQLMAQKGISADSFAGGLMKDPTKGFEILEGAPDDVSVPDFFNSIKQAGGMHEEMVAVTKKIAGDGGQSLEDLQKQLAIFVKHKEMIRGKWDTTADLFRAGELPSGHPLEGVTDPEKVLKFFRSNFREKYNEDMINAEMTKNLIKRAKLNGGMIGGGSKTVTEYIKKMVPDGPIQPGKGNHPLSLFVGKSPDIKKKVYQSVLKKGRSYVVKTFASGAITSSAMAQVALPTILATTGTAMVAAGVSIAVLRKVVKSRQKTLNKCIEILSEPIKANPEAKEIADNMEDVGVDPATSSDELEVAPPHEELKGVLQFPRRELEKSGYPKDDIDDVFDAAFDAENNKDARDALLHNIQDSYSLMGLLLNEDMAFDDMGRWINTAAKKAGKEELSDKQKAHLAMGINVGPDIGEITDLPDAAELSQAKKELSDLEKQFQSLSDEKQKLADNLVKAEENQLIDFDNMRSMKKAMSKEIEDLKNGKLSMEELIKELQEKAEQGEVDAGEAIMAANELEEKLKAVELAANEKEAELMSRIRVIAKQANDMSRKSVAGQNKRDQFIVDMFGEAGLMEMLEDPDAFVKKQLEKDKKAQQDMLDQLDKKQGELTRLEDQLKAAQNASKKAFTVEKIYQKMKKLKGLTQGYAKDWKNLKDDKRKRFPKERIPRIKAALKDEFGVDLEVQEESYKTRENLLLERWSQLAGLPVISESHHRSMKKLISEGNFLDAGVEENLRLLEDGNELMMEEDELIALEEYCEFNQIDCDLDVFEYGNGFAVTMYQANPSGGR